MTVLPLEIRCSPPGDEVFARNYIGGSWVFPAAPYEYEIRSPSDSSVTTTVPLSSRFDVARAVTAAHEAALGVWGDAVVRTSGLGRMVTELRRMATELGSLQALETGLSGPDSLEAVLQGIRLFDEILAAPADSQRQPGGGTGHILSWGLPFLEVVASTVPQLVAGNCVVVKPSLLAPISAAAFTHVAHQVGLPAGVVNMVQGTGLDVGSALLDSRQLVSTHVRAGAPVRAAAERAAVRTGVPCFTIGAGCNVAVVAGNADLDAVVAAVLDAVRVHSAGGPLGLPLLLAHQSIHRPLIDAITASLTAVTPAPLPSSRHREQARFHLEHLVRAGARLAFNRDLPDDVSHRMGWRLPPDVAVLPDSSASSLSRGEQPMGPVVEIAAWTYLDDLDTVLSSSVRKHGVVTFWGMDAPKVLSRQATVARDRSPLACLRASVLPASWRTSQ